MPSLVRAGAAALVANPSSAFRRFRRRRCGVIHHVRVERPDRACAQRREEAGVPLAEGHSRGARCRHVSRRHDATLRGDPRSSDDTGAGGDRGTGKT
jgi:hypothetical protein